MQKIIDAINNMRVYEIMKQTPVSYLKNLSQRYQQTIYLKREDKTPVRSFKLRGAYQKISALSKEEKARGIITASAGNHAQGVAMSAQKLGINAIVVMPKTSPKIKINSVKQLGAEVILEGNIYDEAYKYAKKLSQTLTRTLIHPYDDIEVIAGQASIAIELLTQLNFIDFIFVPVGGGGLITGIGVYIKKYKPNIKIIGVESDGSPTLTESLIKKRRVELSDVGLFADGVATKRIGSESFRLSTQLVDDTVLVSNDEVCAAIKDIYDDTRSIAEPSGALSLAGVKRYIKTKNLNNKKIVAILSGANMNFDRLRHIAERAELGKQKEAIFAVTIPEKAGSFLRFCQLLENRVITEFNYRYADKKEAYIFVGIALENGRVEEKQIFEILNANYKTVDMSDNEIAKTHVRYMVGGKAQIDNEVIYRFTFPEKPGALLKFLLKIGSHWNISLFHYRNHGADFGRVLIGLEALGDMHSLESRFKELDYIYHRENNNPAYHYFLANTKTKE